MNETWKTFKFDSTTGMPVERNFNYLFDKYGYEAAWGYLVSSQRDPDLARNKARVIAGLQLGPGLISNIIIVFNEPGVGENYLIRNLGLLKDKSFWFPPLWSIAKDGFTYYYGRAVAPKEDDGTGDPLPSVDEGFKSTPNFFSRLFGRRS